MRAARLVRHLLFALGVLLGSGAVLLLLRVAGPAPGGWEDLAALAGAQLLLVLAGLPAGAWLVLATRGGRLGAPAWQMGVATALAALSVLAAAVFLVVAGQGENLPLLAFLALVLAVALAGLVRAGRLALRRAA